MKKSISLIAFILISFFATNYSKSDIISLDYKYNINSFNTFGWQVAELYTYGEKNYTNPTNSNGKYNNAQQATQWGDFVVDWTNTAWSDAEQGTRKTWLDSDKWLAITPDNDNKVNNGFYAFKYTMMAEDAIGYPSVEGMLNLFFGADDYLAAVYANGDLLYSQSIIQGATVGNDANNNGNWLSLESTTFNVDLVDGKLDLIFVVHNTNAAGSPSVNPMGLYIDGSLSTNIAMVPPSEPVAATPEPATFLIFSIAGIFFAIKRKAFAYN